MTESHNESNFLEETLLGVPYFHLFKSIEQVMKAMLPYLGTNGHFLVRRSLSKPNTLTVTVTDNCTVKHFNVQIHNGVYHLHDKYFFSIAELCSYHNKHDVPNAEGYKDIRLVYPIQNPSYKPKREPLPRPPETLVQCPHSADSVNTSFSSINLRRSKTCSNLKSQSLSTQNGVSSCTYGNLKGRRPSEGFSDGFEDSKASRKLVLRSNSRELWHPPKGRLASLNANDLEEQTETTVAATTTTTTTTVATTGEQFEDQPLYYSSVRSREKNVLEDVLEQLRLMENVDKCSCGLPLSETELCEGWSVHLSTEPITLGMVFFTSPSGNTSWKLPSRISRQLTPSQRDFIKLLKQKKSLTMKG